MPENIISFSESQAYQRHHRDEDYWTPPTTPAAAVRPAPVIPIPTYRGRFQKGFDPRRHKLTPEERALGFERAMLSVDERFPNARCEHGAALSHCLLRAKHPQFFTKDEQTRQAA